MIPTPHTNESESPQTVCFLLEIADPNDTTDPAERRERLARFRLFSGVSESIGFDLRLVDAPYYQPAISVDPLVGEVPLLLLVARQRSATPRISLARDEVRRFVEYVYPELYLPRFSPNPATQELFAKDCRSLLDRVIRGFPIRYRCSIIRPILGSRPSLVLHSRNVSNFGRQPPSVSGGVEIFRSQAVTTFFSTLTDGTTVVPWHYREAIDPLSSRCPLDSLASNKVGLTIYLTDRPVEERMTIEAEDASVALNNRGRLIYLSGD
jgi:hypothetical protein